MRKQVGNVTPEERDEIQTLFERKNGLTELAAIVSPDNQALYDKLVKDMGHTVTLFQQWWDNKSAQYGWESAPNGHWEINFDSCTVFLVWE